MSLADGMPVCPAGTMPLPGDTVRQVVRAPVIGVVATDVPLQVDQKTAKVQFLATWKERDADGVEHEVSTWFEAADVEILERATQAE